MSTALEWEERVRQMWRDGKSDKPGPCPTVLPGGMRCASYYTHPGYCFVRYAREATTLTPPGGTTP